MISPTDFDWLPEFENWSAQAKAIAAQPSVSWSDLTTLANARLDFTRTNRLDDILRRRVPEPPAELTTKAIRLALLGSSTLLHLHAGSRVGGLRRGLWIDTYENDYGQYFQELLDPNSALRRFKPTAVLFAFDAQHLTASANAAMKASDAKAAREAICAKVRECWRIARDALGCQVIQQTLLPTSPLVLGANEHRLPGSRAAMIDWINSWLREVADDAGVDLLALDARAGQDGLLSWHDPALWHRSKQEVSPRAAPMYGDLVARILAAKAGRSYKCLVLDLDNTLWGGVIGDDGLDGIVIGQGSPLGEAYLAVQHYARELSRRGVILAVCSKNDEVNALEPFEKHQEMLLKRSDIACFKANWNDKVQNLRTIADEINIGLDSVVFLDDNPFERSLVRRELPMVAVPEVGEDPSYFSHLLARAGYFEGLAVTSEDLNRSQQYQANVSRDALKAASADLPSYLRSLDMELLWQRFDELGLQRVVQLINKTNQFNLTTQRYDEAAVRAVMNDPKAVGLQLRLLDRFGDNGIIAIVIGRAEGDDFLIDTWLMSCRVLGRQVEATTLNLIAEQARALGVKRLVGTYRPTKKNGMVKDHYAKLGFTLVELTEDGSSRNLLNLQQFQYAETAIAVRNVETSIPAGSPFSGDAPSVRRAAAHLAS
jgi:FkbH-like protein